MGLTASFLSAAKKAMFNPNSWKPVGEPVSLEEIWNAMAPGMYEEIDGDVATVTSVTFDDGNTAYRISVPMKGGDAVELNLSPQSDLTEDDEVAISSITGQLLRKAGQDDIIKYDGELYEEEEDEEDEDKEPEETSSKPEPKAKKPKRTK